MKATTVITVHLAIPVVAENRVFLPMVGCYKILAAFSLIDIRERGTNEFANKPDYQPTVPFFSL